MFFLFASKSHHECGGLRDYQGTYATLEKAKAATETMQVDFGEVATLKSGELWVVAEFDWENIGAGVVCQRRWKEVGRRLADWVAQ